MMHPEGSRAEVATAATRLVARLAGGDVGWHDVHVVPAADGSVPASARLHAVGEREWHVVLRRRPRMDDRRRAELRDLIADVTEDLRRRDAHAAECRVDVEDAAGFEDGLRETGWTRDHDRTEFEARLDELPHEVDSPIVWTPMSSRDDAARLLGEVAIGDPTGGDIRAAPGDLLEAWLNDPALTSGADTVHLGVHWNRALAFCMAQVNGRTGWSRITYMGLHSDARGQRLSRWVHRHGFEMMRAQAGTHYAGGTAVTNGPMMHLFRTHGCREMRRLQVWRLSLAQPTR
jgi:hypothetical protein